MKLRLPDWNEEIWMGVGILGLIVTLLAGFMIYGLTRPEPAPCVKNGQVLICLENNPRPSQRAGTAEQ